MPLLIAGVLVTVYCALRFIDELISCSEKQVGLEILIYYDTCTVKSDENDCKQL